MSASPSFPLDREVSSLRSRVSERLAQLVPEATAPPEKLHRAIHYSLLAPGKRVRPVVAVLSARAFGCRRPAAALDPGCAIEMVHAASLIVDDMPFMDDARVRRGRAAAHRAFGLRTATLASLALLNRAFRVLAEAEAIDEPTRNRLVHLLSRSLGDTGGAIAGQEEDFESSGECASLSRLESMVRHKTGALFVASVEAGALVAGAGPEGLVAARDFGWSFGLCFQALDDLADRPGAADGSGDDEDKATFVSILGADETWLAAERYAESAIEALRAVNLEDSALAELTRSMVRVEEQRAEVVHLQAVGRK